LSFTPGTTTQSFTVPVIGDTLGEVDETFTAVLSTPVNASLADGTGVATIVDNDAAINVTAPNTAVTWAVGSNQTIAWTHNLGAGTSVRIELTRNNGAAWETLAASAPNSTATTGTFAWTVTGPPTTAARVRVVWVAKPAVSDQSKRLFRIQ
jgi:hypothetical protein